MYKAVEPMYFYGAMLVAFTSLTGLIFGLFRWALKHYVENVNLHDTNQQLYIENLKSDITALRTETDRLTEEIGRLLEHSKMLERKLAHTERELREATRVIVKLKGIQDNDETILDA